MYKIVRRNKVSRLMSKMATEATISSYPMQYDTEEQFNEH